ncbi:MAG TPA: phage major capsid protein [Verrucomicrobiae bacterium]|jgi:HK97 family phage major capsid protein|nr:phage major capsid protein [Verrucomicrobiae bacterium]
MNTIRREIHPQIKVLDADAGIVEYVASDETVDCYREVIMASGWKFDRFARNAPFVDSHQYDSIENLLGKVIDFQVQGNKLVETVKWAIDVPSNELAQKGFAMTQGGYLKAVSVGFLPETVVSKFDNDAAAFNQALEKLDLGDDLAESVRCIYTSQQQTELSACIIGANPSALARAYSDGILDYADLLRYPAIKRAVESENPSPRRSYSFAPATTPEKTSAMKKTFLDSFTALTRSASAPTAKQAADAAEAARHGQSETQIFRAAGMVRREMAAARHRAADEVIREILSDPQARAYYNALLRYACRAPGRAADVDIVRRSLTPSSFGGGNALLPIDVSKDIFDLVGINGAFRDLGVTPMSSMFTKFAQTTANPTAYWITPGNIGNTITADVALTGSSLTPEANTLAILLVVSRELLWDEKADLSYYLLSRFSQGIAGAVDYAAFQGSGANDTTNGSQTGIFIDNTITSVNSAQGNNAINQLQRADFLAAIAAVSPAALQRPCRWFVSTSFIAPLLTLVDGVGKSYLLKTPSETGDGQWYLCGFPVTWGANIPANNAAGQKIAAFGHGPSYMVAMREELEVMLGDSATGFATNEQTFRALGRGFCQTRQASGLVTLALSN